MMEAGVGEEAKSPSIGDSSNNREIEIKLKLWKRRYEEELSSFNEYRIEHVMKNSGVKEYFERIKEKDRVRDDTIRSLKRELELKRDEINLWRNKCNNYEKQCSVYWHQLQESQHKLEELEAERRMKEERERHLLGQSMNMSYASSLVDNRVPPPPPVPINIPSVEEIMRMSSTITSNSSLGGEPSTSLSFAVLDSSSVPYINSDYNGSIRGGNVGGGGGGGDDGQTRSTSSTNGGGSMSGRSKVGSRYGKIFSSRSGNISRQDL